MAARAIVPVPVIAAEMPQTPLFAPIPEPRRVPRLLVHLGRLEMGIIGLLVLIILIILLLRLI